LAAVELVEKTGAEVEGLGFLAVIKGLGGVDQLAAHETVTVLGEV
jgi:adenine/guanine phosphoribosyltransferase-like PRPP-binding protein